MEQDTDRNKERQSRIKQDYTDAIYKTGQLYAYECSKDDVDFLEIKFEYKSDSTIGGADYPLLISVNENQTISDIRKLIFDLIKPIIPGESDDSFYIIEIFNNRPAVGQSLFEKKYAPCEFCSINQHKGNCLLTHDCDPLTLREMRAKMTSKRNLILREIGRASCRERVSSPV